MKMILFDMDGTLINSGSMISNTINYVRENIGLEKLDKSHILENVNDPAVNSAEFFYGTKEFTDTQSELFEEYYSKNCLRDLELYHGIENMLDDYKDEFIFTVVTNANSDFANKMLSYMNIDKYFDGVIGYNDVSKPKPNPEMVYKMLDKYSIEKYNAQLVGDSLKDTQAAFNAGIDSVLVNWGFSNHKENAIESIDELRERIESKFLL